MKRHEYVGNVTGLESFLSTRPCDCCKVYPTCFAISVYVVLEVFILVLCSQKDGESSR